MSDGLAVFLVVVGFVVLVAVGPLFSIWAVNTLFATAIPVTFKTWASAFWINLLIASSKK